MRRKLVFDAGLLALGFGGDPRVKEYFDDVAEERAAGYVSGPNLAEFYYVTCRKLGKQTADAWYFRALESGLAVAEGDYLDRLAGQEKCKDGVGLSLADCYALALARSEGALLLTTDSGLANVVNAKVKHIPP